MPRLRHPLAPLRVLPADRLEEFVMHKDTIKGAAKEEAMQQYVDLVESLKTA